MTFLRQLRDSPALKDNFFLFCTYLLNCLPPLPFSAQAFQDAFGDFIVWLRETERKIQRDDPLKLEVGELKTGLAHLQVL